MVFLMLLYFHAKTKSVSFRSTKLDESKYDFIFVKNLRELWETIMDIYLINKEKFGEFSTINEVW